MEIAERVAQHGERLDSHSRQLDSLVSDHQRHNDEDDRRFEAIGLRITTEVSELYKRIDRNEERRQEDARAQAYRTIGIIVGIVSLLLAMVALFIKL